MNNAIKLETEANMECFIYLVIGEVVCHETDVARQLDEGKAFAEHNKTVFDVAMAVAKFYKEQLDLRMDAYERERKALDEIAKLNEHIKKVCAESSADIQRLDAENKKLKHELSKCRASNAFYLDDKQKAVKRAELLEKEVADLKVPELRQNRHLRDELHRSRLECQQAWGKVTEELANKATVESELQRLIAERNKYRNFAIELCDKFEAMKQQLDGMEIVKENIPPKK